MVLDTNVKRFKYSALKKFLCILLSLVTFLGAGRLAFYSIYSFCYFEGIQSTADYTASSAFRWRLENDVSELMQYAYYTDVNNNKTAELEACREAAVSETLKKYNSMAAKQEEEQAQYESSDKDYDYDYYDNYDATVTTMHNWDLEVIRYSVETKSYGSFTFNFDFSAIRNDTYSKTVEEQINDYYDMFISNECQGNGYPVLYQSSSIRYYVRSNHFSDSNFDRYDVTEKDAYNAEMYISFKDGKLTSKGIDEEETISLLQKMIFDSKDYSKMELLLFFDMDDEPKTIIESLTSGDEYSSIRDNYNTAVKHIENIEKNAAVAAVLLMISFVLAFLYFRVAGKKNEDEKAKLAFIDYVPIGLHTAVCGAVCTGGVVLITILLGELIFSKAVVYGTMLCAAAMWLLIMELCGSIARSIMSDRKFYKFFLVYWLFFGLFRLLKGSGKGCSLLFGKLRRLIGRCRAAVKKIFAYKSGVLRKNAILLTVLYFACNFAAICFVFFFGVAELYPLAFLMLLLILAVNVFVVIKAVKYLISLDTIITAASEHREPVVDLQSLPSSLETLAQSMKYTNIELQNAVAKAVKDERLRSELITNVSHDLKTPLTSIITYVDLLSKCDINDDKAKEYIAVLDNKGAKLKKLIDDLIEASKVTSGNVSVNLTTINLAELCLQSTVDAQSDFEKAGLDLIVKDCEKAPVVIADGAKTFRIIENLLSNARKYSARASRVYVDVFRDGDCGVFEIKNISAEPLDISPDELTERFVRGDKSRNQEGNGLGLSIAKELCRLQNGTLELVIDGDLFKAIVRLPLA